MALAVIASVALIFMGTSAPHLTVPDRNGVRYHDPWIYGSPSAQFTVVEYADLECPYCRAYFPVLRHWIDEHPAVNWEWRNLPLPMHEPAATREALLAECAGEVNGNSAFWRAIAWLYDHTDGNGAGLAAGTQLPGMSRAIRACLKSNLPHNVIRLQATDAADEHILDTPTIRLLDRNTGRTLELQGPVEGDELLSALDLLASPHGRTATGGTSH